MMINWVLKGEIESLLDKKENWFGLWDINWEIEIIFWVMMHELALISGIDWIKQAYGE